MINYSLICNIKPRINQYKKRTTFTSTRTHITVCVMEPSAPKHF